MFMYSVPLLLMLIPAVSSDLNLLGCFHHEDIHSSCPEKIVSYEAEEQKEGRRKGRRVGSCTIIHVHVQS